MSTTHASWVASDPNPANTLATPVSWALQTWGKADAGQTGVDLQTSSTPTSTRMPGPEKWSSVSATDESSCGVTTVGDLFCWGDNAYGHLGTGDATARTTPTLVGSGWLSVDAGYIDTCGLKTDRTAWCWGYNPDGELGTGATGDSNVPVAVNTTGVQTWSQVSSGRYFDCGIKTDATLWCWGYNASGRVGNGSTTTQLSPVQIGSATWSRVSAGDDGHACAIRVSGALYCWGYNGTGQVGNGTTADQTAPIAVSGGGTWSDVSAGVATSCGIKTNGTLFCWGSNAYGQVGNGTTTNVTTPQQEATAATNWAAVGSGDSLSCGPG